MNRYVMCHALTVAAILVAQVAVTFELKIDCVTIASGLVSLLAIRASGKVAQLHIDRAVGR